MTTTAMKRKSMSGGECPFGAKKVKTESAQNGVAAEHHHDGEKKPKKPKVKKTLPKQNGKDEKQKVGGGKKAIDKKRDVTKEADDGPAVNHFGGVPAKAAENFRQQLTKGSVAVDGKCLFHRSY